LSYARSFDRRTLCEVCAARQARLPSHQVTFQN